MKKRFLVIAVVIMFTTTAFADENSVSFNIINNFKTNFNNAKNVSWKLADDYVKASFEFNGISKVAIYNYEGELLATSNKFKFDNLPQNAIETIAKKYPFPPYKLKDCIELVDADSEKNYFASFETAKETVVLKISLAGKVSVFSKKKN